MRGEALEDIIIKRIDQIHIMVVDQSGHPHTIQIKDIINAKDEELLFSSTNESEERGI